MKKSANQQIFTSKKESEVFNLRSSIVFGSVVILLIILLVYTFELSISCDTAYAKDDSKDESKPSNAISDQGYKDFGLSLKSAEPSDFTEGGSDPLENFVPKAPSWLYLGEMNKKSSNAGYFTVMDTLMNINKNSLTIDFNASNKTDQLGSKFIGLSTPFPQSKSTSNYNTKEFKYHTQNAVSVGMGKEKNGSLKGRMIVDNTLFSGEENIAGKYKTTSQQQLCLYALDDKGYWVKKASLINYLVDKNSTNLNSFDKLDQEGKAGLTAMATGDYDGDGIEEVAVYVPDQTTKKPYIQIYKIEKDNLVKWKSVKITDLGNNYTKQFEQYYKDWYLPIVNLSTTDISGKDDLVISVSVPFYDGYIGFDQNASMGIFSFSSGEPKMVYQDYLNYGQERMRFVSTYQSDINGNGVNELIVAGYNNIGYKSYNDKGFLDASYNSVNAIVWNGKGYDPVWDKPLRVDGLVDKNLNINYVMTEPVALTSATYEGRAKEKLFLEGVVLEYVNTSDNSNTSDGAIEKDESMLLKDGKFRTVSKMTLPGKNKAWISTAQTGSFGNADRESEQTIIMCGDHNPTDLINHEINYHLSWIWSANNLLKIENTNPDYFHHRPSQKNGTFLTPLVISDDANGTYYKFKEKSYGWSAPEVLAVLPSLPSWDELDSKSSAGETSFSITSGKAKQTEGNLNMESGGFVDLSLQAGPGIAGSGVRAGPTGSLEITMDCVLSHYDEHSSSETVTYSSEAGEDNVVIFAMPVVVYKYDMWLPEYVVTQKEIDDYNKMAEYTEDAEPFPYELGETVPGHYEPVNVSYQYAAINQLMSVDEYNLQAEKYELDKVHMDKILNHTVGDPTLYPNNTDEIPSFREDDVRSMVSGLQVIDTNGNKSIAISKEHTKSNGFELDLGFNFNLGVHITGSVSFVANGEVDFQGGAIINRSAGCNWVSSTTKGNEFTGSFSALPKGAEDYTFNTSLAIWNSELDGSAPKKDRGTFLENSKWADSGAFIVGYTAEVNGDMYPPKLPQDPYVYAATDSEVILSWEDPGEYRKADYYEIYVKQGSSYERLKQRISPNQNYYAIYGLEAGKDYTFAFKAISRDGADSVMSSDIKAHTRTKNSLSFESAPKDCYVNVGDTASFSAIVTENKDVDRTKYQWYEFTGDSSDDNPWKPIPGAIKPTYVVGKVTKDNISDLNGTRYKLHVNQYKKGKSIPDTIDSRTVSIYSGEKKADIDLSLSKTDGGSLIEHEGEYYIAGNHATSSSATKIKMNANVKSQSGQAYNKGTVAFVISDSDGNNVKKLKGSKIDSQGNSTAIWEVDEEVEGTYFIQAFYVHGDIKARSDIPALHILSIDAPTQPPIIKHSTKSAMSIDYHLDGGTNAIGNPDKVSSDEKIILNAPQKQGYKFSGWYSDPDKTNKVTTLTAGSEKSSKKMSLYAKWDVEDYLITYVLGGGTNNSSNPSTYTIDKKVTLKDPTKENYTFDGWYSDSIFTNEITKINKGSTGTVTLYAKWIEKKLYDPEDPVTERTIKNNTYGITLTGNIHSAATLRIKEFERGAIKHDDYKTRLQKGRVLAEVYELELVYPDGTPAKYEGNLSVSFDQNMLKKYKWESVKAIQLIDDKKVVDIDSEIIDDKVSLQTDKLSIFALTGEPIKVESVKVNYHENIVRPGKSINLNAEVAPTNAYYKAVSWKSSNTKIATVNVQGQVKGVSEGKVKIIAGAKDGSKIYGELIVTVAKDVSEIASPLDSIYLVKDKDFTVPVVAYGANSNSTNTVSSNTSGSNTNLANNANSINAKLRWTSSNNQIASVDSSGVISPKKNGNTVITVHSLNGKKLDIKVKVVSKSTKPDNVTVSGAPKTLKIGQTGQLKVKLSPATATNVKINFISKYNNVLTVDSAGKIKAMSKGHGMVVAIVGNKVIKKKIIVE